MRNPNGYGAVVKLSGNRRKPFAVRITTGWEGEETQKYKYLSYHEKREDALKALAKHNEDPYKIDRDKLTFAMAYEKWSEKAYQGITEKSVIEYKRYYDRSAKLHDMKLVDIKTDALQKIMDELKVNFPTARKLRSLWRNVFDWAMKNDIVVKNYVDWVDIGKEVRSESHKPFTQAELDLAWSKVADFPSLDFVLITSYTGMRPSELLDMRKENINLEARTMQGGSKTAAGKDRIIPIHKRIIPLIQARMDGSDSDYLISSPNGRKMRYSDMYNSLWPDAMAALNLGRTDHKPHDGRHTCTSNLDRKGANKMAMKFILGHKSQDVTEKVYTHKVIEDLLAAIDLLD